MENNTIEINYLIIFLRMTNFIMGFPGGSVVKRTPLPIQETQ